MYDVVVNMSARTVSVVDKTVIVEESRSVLLCVLFFSVNECMCQLLLCRRGKSV